MDVLRKDLYQQHLRLWPLSQPSVSVSTENNAMFLRSRTCSGKTFIRSTPKPTVASGSVVTSLGIPLSHMRESKVVYALLGASWAY